VADTEQQRGVSYMGVVQPACCHHVGCLNATAQLLHPTSWMITQVGLSFFVGPSLLQPACDCAERLLTLISPATPAAWLLCAQYLCTCLQAQTPLSLKATAGLRLLPGDKADKILEAVRALFKQQPFKLGDNAVSIMDGGCGPLSMEQQLTCSRHSECISHTAERCLHPAWAPLRNQ
jgi:hypothetical protein